MLRLVIPVFIVFIAVLGFFTIVSKRKRILEEKSFIDVFLQKLELYITKPYENTEAYQWMILNSHKLQSILGRYGFFIYHQPGLYTLNNFKVLDAIPLLRQAIDTNTRIMIGSMSRLIEDSLLGYGGRLNESLKAVRSELLNPIIWLREGSRIILALPFVILGSLGLISGSRTNEITNSSRFQVISSLFALVGLFSFAATVVGFVVDFDAFLIKWDEFLARFSGGLR